MKSVRRPRFALAAAAMGLALASTGCSYFNPVQTHDFYQAADGMNASLTSESTGVFELGIRNAIVVVGEDGTGQLLGTLVNYTAEPAQVTITASLPDGAEVLSETVELEPGTEVKLTPPDLDGGEQPGVAETVDVSAADFPAEPGTIIELTLSSGDRSETISLPVTGTTLPYYQGSDGGEG